MVFGTRAVRKHGDEKFRILRRCLRSLLGIISGSSSMRHCWKGRSLFGYSLLYSLAVQALAGW